MNSSFLATGLLAATSALLVSTPASAQCAATELTALEASDLFAGDQFGRSVDVDGDYAVVGASEESFGVGSAYLFQWTGTAWVEVAKLTPSNGVSGDKFGTSVAISGDTVVVGAYQPFPAEEPGLAYVFVEPGGGWTSMTESARLTASDAFPNDNFGYAVDIDGDTIVVGSYLHDDGDTNTGTAFVYERPLTGWATATEDAKLTASDFNASDQFGISVAIAGDTIAVGADRDSDVQFQAGSAYVFQRAGASWTTMTETAKLTVASPTAIDRFGISVGVGDQAVVVGAWAEDAGGTQAGAAYVFERPVSGWIDANPDAKLTASDAAAGDHFGWAVDMQDDVIAVGAPANLFDGSGLDAAYLFLEPAAGWADATEDALLTQAAAPVDDEFGLALALGGGRLHVGAHFFAAGGFSNAGGSFLFAGADDCNGNGLLDLCEIVATPSLDADGDGRLDACARGAVSYCTAGTSANGCQALLSASGTPSATAPTGFSLEATGVEGAKDGLFFFAANGQQANSWGNGTSFQCVTPPVLRGGLLVGSGTPGACDGTFVQDLNARWTAKPNQNPGAGAVVQAQLWYRDPQNTSNQTTSLSDALEFSVQP